MSDEPKTLSNRERELEAEIERLRDDNQRLMVAMGRATDLATAAIYQLNERKWQQF